MKIHPSAIIHPDAELADDVEVQAYSVVGPKVRIGAGTVVGPHCVLDGDTVVGERNRFFSGAQVGILSQDLKHNWDLPGRTVIGDDNIIREYATITSSTMESEDEMDRVTSIGDRCLLMTYVHVGHDCHIGNGIVLASYVGLSGHVLIEDNANIAGHTGVHQDARIGSYAFVAGMSRMAKDAPPYMIIEGNPCRCISPNTVGLQRNGFDKASRSRIKEIYRIMFRSDLNTVQGLEEIERSVDPSEERSHFVEFARQSVRGITK